jgi:MerR family transcriptional regulator/heat shock protein HspR
VKRHGERRESRDRNRDSDRPSGEREREGVFRIGAIAEKYGIHPQTLRMYEREGLLRPARTEGNTRLYDSDTIERLEIILTLTRHLGVNLAGVEVILHMKQRMEKMNGEVQKMLVVLREELDTRRPSDRSVALARIPGRPYALVKSDR